MNKEEIYELLDKLDRDEWDTDLYKVPLTWCELYDIRDYINFLEQENKQLKDNWNKLKDEIKNNYIVGHKIQNDSMNFMLLKMQELEIGGSNENIPGYIVEGNLKGKVIEEIPQFKGTLDQLDDLCNIESKGDSNE